MRADRVKRREFITLLGSAAAAWPLVARAQSPRPRPLIAWLSGGAHANSQFATDAFLQGVRDLGYISRFCAPVHLLAIYERGIRHDGATIIGGLPKATLFERKESVCGEDGHRA
jgi:hypothetical protein